MNKLLRKLTISVLAVVFAVIAMGATTYAWFTVTGEVSVAQIDGNVTMDSGIEISGDGVNWDNALSIADLGLNLVGEDAVLKALTSSDGTTFYSVSGITLSGTDYIATYDNAAGGYISATFYIRSANKTSIYLNSATLTGSIINEDPLNPDWIPDIAYTDGKGASITSSSKPTLSVADAARFAINTKALSTWGSSVAGSTYEGTPVSTIFENPSSTSNTEGFGLDITKGALNYYLLKNTIETTGTTVKSKIGEATANAVAVPETVLTNANQHDKVICTLAAGDAANTTGYYYAKIVVTIWIEGWDNECFNSILSIDKDHNGNLTAADLCRSLHLTLQFTAENPAVA